MVRQIPLDLTPDPEFTFDNFLPGSGNREAVALVSAWPEWPSPILLLVGPRGSGKTHLGLAWAEKHNGRLYSTVQSRDLSPVDVIFVDDARRCDPEGLFTLMNAALNGKISGLLLSDRDATTAWDIAIPDLRSRLVNTPIVRLEEHEDDLLEAIIRKLFEDFGRAVKADVVTYLMNNHDRSVDAMRECVRKLEIAAREANRDMTRAFVAAQLKS